MTQQPTGTVTFLFTDIEGSTRLAQMFSSGWPAAQTRHDTILRSAIESHRGHVFQVIGDAFCAAFHTAPDALAAAVDVQRAVHAGSWTVPIGVRMGIHSGSATARPDGDYEGYLTLVRVQRIMAAGHGGQVLLSEDSYALARRDLPADVSFRDLGMYHLKDLATREHIWQLVVSGLVQDYPPLKAVDQPNNLPTQLTSFVGREAEINEVRRLLGATRLLTLVGAGGVGKTRLALQAARSEVGTFHDGVWLAELAPLNDPALIPSAVAAAVGIREVPGSSLIAMLCDYFQQKDALLVLDNCEHVLAGSAGVVNQLLLAAPGLRVMATSREALGAAGEQTYRVPSLALPADARNLESLTCVESVQLFVERARAARSDFALTAANAEALAQICLRLDGVPLAIELAAARVRIFTPEQIATRLDDRFRLLTGGSRSALPRQQTLRATIDWSHNLLSAQEQALLRRLSVFAGGWTFEAAEEVCPDERLPGAEVLDRLTQLIDKSLVVCEERDQEVRYRLLETVRQYARERLLDSGEMATVRDRHLVYCVDLAEAGGRGMEGSGQVRWERRLRTEFDNLRVALDWAAETSQNMAGLRIMAGLWFWSLVNQSVECYKRGRIFLAGRDVQGPSRERARVLAAAVFGADWVIGSAEAAGLAREGLAAARASSDAWAEAASLLVLNTVSDDVNWCESMNEALNITRHIGDRFLEGFILWTQSDLYHRHGYYREAERAAADGIALLQSFGEHHLQAGAQRALARALSHRPDAMADAMEHLRESIRLNQVIGEELGLARCLCLMADLSARSHCYGRAMRFCGAIAAWHDASGIPQSAMYEDHRGLEQALAEARQNLSERDGAAEYAAGRTMTLAAAVAMAIEWTQDQAA